MRFPVIQGHRGALYAEAENTMAAFKAAHAAGASSIELDVFMTKDDQLVVCHGSGSDVHAGGLESHYVLPEKEEESIEQDEGLATAVVGRGQVKNRQAKSAGEGKRKRVNIQEFLLEEVGLQSSILNPNLNITQQPHYPQTSPLNFLLNSITGNRRHVSKCAPRRFLVLQRRSYLHTSRL